MIDEHLLARCDIELIGHERFNQMPRKSGISREGLSHRKAPPFVGISVLAGGPDRERRHFVEEEVQAVVVVDDNGNVGLHGVEPFVHRLVCIEERLPRGFVLPTPRDSLANGRDVRSCDSADDRGHDLPSSCMDEHVFEFLFRHAALLRPHLLHVHPEDAGPLRQVVDVCAGPQQFQNVTPFYGAALFVVETELSAITVFVVKKSFAVLGGIE
jgi:hypothetical protein